MNERQLQNLLLFLDRVEYKGLKEIEALNEILASLQLLKLDQEGEQE